MKKIPNLFFMFVLSCALVVFVSAVGNADNRGGEEPFGAEAATDLDAETSPLLPSDESPYDGLDEETIEIMKGQEPAIKAYKEFMSHVEDCGEGEFLYPDTFAGAYIDTDTYHLCILLTDCSEETVTEYNKYFSDPSIVEYIEAKYSYNDLVKIQDEFTENLKDFRVIGIDQKKNVVSIGVGKETETSAGKCGEYIFPEEYPVEFYYTEGVTTLSRKIGRNRR